MVRRAENQRQRSTELFLSSKRGRSKPGGKVGVGSFLPVIRERSKGF